MTYSEKLKDPRWQKKRLKVFERDGWKCVRCGSSKNELNVHHLTYRRNPWDSPMRDLMTLCKDCHSLKHRTKAQKSRGPVVSQEDGKAAFEAMRRAME